MFQDFSFVKQLVRFNIIGSEYQSVTIYKPTLHGIYIPVLKPSVHSIKLNDNRLDLSFLANLGIEVFDNLLQYFVGYKSSIHITFDFPLRSISLCSKESTLTHSQGEANLPIHITNHSITSFAEQILKGMSIRFSYIEPFIKIKLGFLLYYEGECRISSVKDDFCRPFIKITRQQLILACDNIKCSDLVINDTEKVMSDGYRDILFNEGKAFKNEIMDYLRKEVDPGIESLSAKGVCLQRCLQHLYLRSSG